ncbi:MAG: phosphoenolpyruvate carboxylase, partial [Acidobacteriota bacterium]
MAYRHIHFPDKDRPLRDDVSTLATLVGEVIHEQGGDTVDDSRLFDLVERVRHGAIERRETGRDDALDAVIAEIVDQGPDEIEPLVRAFLTYFRVVNLTEQIHRIRRRRAYQREGRSQSGSWRDTLERLRRADLDLDQVLDLLRRTTFEPVFTAHPTEATRRSLL